METGLANKGVLLVGGTAGVGRSVADLLAAEGARIVLCGRHDETVTATVEDLSKSGPTDVTGFRCDVTVPEDVEALVSAAISALGRIDILIHTAGDSWKRDIFTVTDEQMYETWALNLLAPVRTIRAVAPHMRDSGGGVIVLLGALSAKQPIPGFIPGNTSKAG
ncbi:MAG: SDR family NAD(P)-dependent oxidoreductase, partial [Verrucomicrobia bacterium]|nr:SDR family NAD(P)-dependent oxidoreductase [Verrucomicrobiota bacterium]